MRWWLIPDQCLLMKTRDISLFPALPEWTLIRGAHSCSTASLVNVHSAGGTSLEAADSPPAAKSHSGCCDPGHPIPALCRRVSHPLLATLWRLLIFQAPLSLTILSQHICAGAFSFRLYLHIKAHFSFPSKNRMVIFLKTQTHAFFYLRSFEDLLCCPDAAFQFLSSLSSFLSCQQIDFFLLQCSILSSICGLPLWCAVTFMLFSARPLLWIVWPVSKDNGEAVCPCSTGLLQASQL